MQELINMKFGPYQIQSHLANGGMANVYLAHNTETEGEPLVAIKLVHTSTGDHCERFRREIKELCTLHHDHILPALAHGELNSWCYLVTPYIEGGTLTRLLSHGPLSLQEAKEIFSQLASALHYAHEQGIVHRDIKSSNVLMRDKHYTYLADFGLVKHIGCDVSLTLPGDLIGTPEYMAPELAEKGASPRSDIYALGILLYQMLTGRVPFKGESPITVYLKHIQEQPENPSVWNPAIPPEVEQVVLRALAKDPSKRYQTVQDFNMVYQHALVQANTRQLRSAETATRLLSTMLPVPQVRLVKVGSLHQSDGLQQQRATLPGLRKLARGFGVLVTALMLLMLLMLLLQSITGQNARQTSLTQLARGPLPQMVRDKGGPKPLSSPPRTPTSKPIEIVQQNQKNTIGDGTSAMRYDYCNYKHKYRNGDDNDHCDNNHKHNNKHKHRHHKGREYDY